jgi:hypothetical protein
MDSQTPVASRPSSVMKGVTAITPSGAFHPLVNYRWRWWLLHIIRVHLRPLESP